MITGKYKYIYATFDNLSWNDIEREEKEMKVLKPIKKVLKTHVSIVSSNGYLNNEEIHCANTKSLLLALMLKEYGLHPKVRRDAVNIIDTYTNQDVLLKALDAVGKNPKFYIHAVNTLVLHHPLYKEVFDDT